MAEKRPFTGEDLVQYLERLPESDPDLPNETATHHVRDIIRAARQQSQPDTQDGNYRLDNADN